MQFVDGDSEITAGWIETAADFLAEHHDIAVVSGRLRERHPERSIYNRLCDIEWEAPSGEADACGGNAMMRGDAVASAGGFRPDLTSGEEPELCSRLRAAGWRIWRLDVEMARHDAAMTRFGQWWLRSVRSGYGYAQSTLLVGLPYHRRGTIRVWVWGICMPLACLALGIELGPWGWASWLIFPLRFLRQTVRGSGPLSRRALSAFFQSLSVFPEGWGQIKFARELLLRRQAQVIEYKKGRPSCTSPFSAIRTPTKPT